MGKYELDHTLNILDIALICITLVALIITTVVTIYVYKLSEKHDDTNRHLEDIKRISAQTYKHHLKHDEIENIIIEE